MPTMIFTLLICNAVVALLLLGLWLHSRKHARTLNALVYSLQEAIGAGPVEANELLKNQNKRLITIEILNPVELATKKTFLAKPLASVSPEMINILVYKETRKIVEQILPDFGAKAVVKIHAG